MTECIETEVLVIGCGVAGGVAALGLADAGVPVMLVTRAAEPADSNTYWAQGGIVYRGPDDSAQVLAEDITRAGAKREGCSGVPAFRHVWRSIHGRWTPDTEVHVVRFQLVADLRADWRRAG